MKKLIAFVVIAATHFCYGQKAQNLFKTSEDNIYWLGVDFSKVQLVGDFSQFAEAGQKSTVEIKTKYFPAWNRLIVDERSKYEHQGDVAQREHHLQHRYDGRNQFNRVHRRDGNR